MMAPWGKQLILLGLVLILVGLVLSYGAPLLKGYKNPLDFRFKSGNSIVYFPLGSSILISIVLSFLIYLFKK